MFNGNIIIFKHLQNLAAESDFGIHHRFFNRDRSEILLTCDTCNCKTRFSASIFYDQSSLIFRCIGIADIDRDTFFTYREDCIFMKYSCSHVRQLSQFSVCNHIDRLWILDDSWISDQETRYICPVFIHIGMYSLCNDRTCDIRTATGECLNTSVWLCTIKSRNNCTLCILQPFRKDLVCLISVKITIFIKDDYFRSIDEFISKICSHDDTIQILSTGSRIISADFLAEVYTDCFKFLIQAQIQVQSSDDAVISLFDCL